MKYPCKSLILCLLAILIVVIAYNGSFLLNSTLRWSLPILNFELSFNIIFISFLLVAFLVVLPARDFTFSEMLSFAFYTVSSLCAILFSGSMLLEQLVLVVIFCELMSLSSFFIVASGCKNGGHAIRYACTHFFVGLLLMIGLSTQNFNLIIIALLINCACFPFSFWVADAYPAASLHGASYLSLFTTKVSFLVALLNTYSFWQDCAEVLAFFGAITAIYGVIFTSLEKNIRRFLAYSTVGQMGMLIMAGSLLSHSENAVPLLVLNIIFSIVYQLLFTAVANSIISRTKVVSFGRASKLLSVEGICATVAILTMAAFPGTAGFIGKSYITTEIGDNLTTYKYLYKILHLLLFLSVGLKFLYHIFIAQNRLKLPITCGGNFSMIALASVCIIAGNPYLFIYNKSLIFDLVCNARNIWSQSSLLFSTALLFIPLRKLFLPRINFSMDVDWFFRAFLPYVAALLSKLILEAKMKLINILQSLTNLLTTSYFNNIAKFREDNSVSFVSATSLMLITVLLLLLCLNH
ncbi:MAG: proton-conducting transporter membrane subunit [Wolbachia endosymbiont of Tyrophagus putrescentiae]|nr:proton-conducting transporter membrane subunit [Wolbachia endosymbiont of Tyrophagus putrescentiae]